MFYDLGKKYQKAKIIDTKRYQIDASWEATQMQ